MATMLLTDIGAAKLAAASGSESAVAIAEIALGDGSGETYAPSHNQTNLVNERARTAIELHHAVDPNSWRVKAEFGPETPAIDVREMGFFDDDGDLIAIWAGVDVVPRQTGVITYLVEHVLDFSAVADGIVLVDAPDDETFCLAVSTGTAIFQLQHEQLLQADAIRAAHGAY